MLKISIIVPVYNVEKYLEECLESIINQTYSNIEIIIINDGSTDNSKFICETYKRKDNRIELLNKKNGGLSSARNMGLLYSTGEYVLFIDSDDYIRLDMCEILVKHIIETGADIIWFNYYNLDNKNNIKYNNLVKEYKLYNELNRVFWKDLLYKYKLNEVVWNKIYKRNIIPNKVFFEGKIHEDTFAFIQILKNATKIKMIKESLYYYRSNRKNSIMHIKNNSNIIDFDAIDALLIKCVDFKRYSNLDRESNIALFYAYIYALDSLMKLSNNEYILEKRYLYKSLRALYHGKLPFYLKIRIAIRICNKQIYRYLLNHSWRF